MVLNSSSRYFLMRKLGFIQENHTKKLAEQSQLPDALFTKSSNMHNKCLKSCLMEVYLNLLYLEHSQL